MFVRLFAFIYRLGLSLRYNVTIEGKEILKNNKTKLILPNHPALIDPQIVLTQVLRYTSVKSVASERYVNKPFIGHVMRFVGVIPVADLSTSDRDTDLLKSISGNVIKALEDNQNVIIYPAGQNQGQGKERIYNKQSAYDAVSKLPENVQVIGLRITGLWGSAWSKAWDGTQPDFLQTFLKSIFFVLANLIFFLPRRRVKLEFVDITEQAKDNSKKEKLEFNTYLEEFYNINGEEKAYYLRHFFYAPKLNKELPKVIHDSEEHVSQEFKRDYSLIDDETLKTVIDIINTELDAPIEGINAKSNLQLDLNLDSLQLVNVIESVEKVFHDYGNPNITLLKTVGDVCLMAMGHSFDTSELKPSFLKNHKSKIRPLFIDKDQNILEQFINSFTKDKDEYFGYDAVSGTSTRKSFMLKAIVVSELIKKKVKGKYVGIMLPALQSSTLLIIASYMAGKIPVMLNWTVGRKILTHCIKTANIDNILTAKSFFDKVSDNIPEEVAQKCIFLEKEVPKISIVTKLKGVVKSLSPKTFINAKNIDKTAVILFTSGSESLPKAVPLTHKNVVSDLWGVFKIIKLDTSNIFFSFLPPFHSFGFSVTSILPLLTGLKIAYTPNPTDGAEVVRTIRHTRPTVLLSTPTFFKIILANATAYDLKSLTLAVSGAESLHQNVLKSIEVMAKGITVLEGYGITECSPVISINPQDKQKLNSVGKVINGVECIIADIDTYKPLESGKEGMILVKGDSIFNGYIDKDIDSPFVNIEGNEYYKTGDLGYIDEEGYLFITGRLKRFIKIGGEMISLPLIEKILLEKYGQEEETVLAVEGSDTTNPPQIVLFTKIKLDLVEVNSYLKTKGLSPLIKVHKIQEVDEIPVLGTGKTDYKQLKELIK